MTNKTVSLLVFSFLIPVAFAGQGSFTNSGGSASGGGGIYISSSITNPAGTVSINCPGTTPMSCAGGSFTYVSNDASSTINASFTSGRYAESCSGGGKGGHITCGFGFTGYFSGTWTVNGAAQAITGVTSQGFVTTGGAGASGRTAFNSAYIPFYYSDSEQILRSDDLLGSNQITYGSQGGGVGQFYGAYGIALDSSGRIYVADTYNCRIVRIDDMHGTNWTTYGGSCGSGQGQFDDPSGIAVDSAGKIYVLDAGNSRLVRIDNMTGANWVEYGSMGTGTGQFAQWLQSLALDSSGRIYVADTGNKRIVRIDDMTGTNWTALTQSQDMLYSFQSPVAVTVDGTGKIYVVDGTSYQPELVRVDSIAGANWTYLFLGSGISTPNSIALDSAGTVFLGGGGVNLVDGMLGVLSSSGNVIAPFGPYYVFGITPVPVPSPRPSAVSISPQSLSFNGMLGTPTDPTPVTITNIGGGVLSVGNISTSSPFAQTNNCPATLTAGQSCTVNVTFNATATGDVYGSLTVTDDSGNAGAMQAVSLMGSGTGPVVQLTPDNLSFPNTMMGGSSLPKFVLLFNNGNAPLNITSITAPAQFSQSNTCGSQVAATKFCIITVKFNATAIGAASGSVAIVDDAGTQDIAVSGTGTSPITLSASSLNFGLVPAGWTSFAKIVTLTNHQNKTLHFTNISTTGDFSIRSNGCGHSLESGASCLVSVVFSPTLKSAEMGTLTFSDDGPQSPQAVTLSGTGW